MGQRKPAILFTAGAVAVATLLGTMGMTANAAETTGGDTGGPGISAYQASAYPKGTRFTVDGDAIKGFDPSDGWDNPSTGYPDSATYEVDGGSVEIHDLPAGWTVSTSMTVNGATGNPSAFYLVKDDDGNTYRWYFDHADDITHTVDELRALTLTLNGKAVDCDPTKDVEVHNVSPSDLVGYEGQPLNWEMSQSGFTEDGVSGYQYVIHPDNSDTPQVTYRFLYDAPDPTDELAGVTATLDDGTPVTGFDPLNREDNFTIPPGHTVTLNNLPAGWSANAMSNDRRTIITVSKSGGGSITYVFDVSDSYQWTYLITQLQNVTALMPDGSPVPGFGWRGGTWTLPAGTSGVKLQGVPDGWNIDQKADGNRFTVTVSSPDGKISVAYVFVVPHVYTTNELRGATATADGQPVEGFDPTVTGTWTVPHGSKVSIGGIPSDWVMTHEDGTLVWTISAPDASVSVTWTFQQETPAASKDDLRTVTASVDGQPVEGFDPVNGGTFAVPAGTTSVDLAGIPEGWTSTPLTDGRLGFTVTSLDGTLSVEYVFAPETVTHTVAFDSAGGAPVDTQTVNDGDKAKEPAAPTRDGYTFKGWWNGDTAYDFAQPVTGDLTLTAHWEQDAPVMHTVTFDTGDETIVIPSQRVEDGMTVVQPDDPTRDGYRFDGWTLAGKPYDFSTRIHADTTLTAKWTRLHTVTFDYAHDGITGTQTVPDGETVRTPATPEREGWTFNGWLLDGQAYGFDTSVTGDITLVADWTRVTYTVTFDTGDGTPVAAQTVNHGERAIDPGTPTRDGWTFTGWLLDGALYDFTTPVTGDITLTAGWEETPDPTPVTHTVTLDPGNGGQAVAVQVVDGGTVGRPNDPTRDGYTFKGWTLDGQPYDFAQPVTGDLTLVAQWEKPAEYTVTFDTQGGSPVDAQTVTENGVVTRPADPTRDGYTFKGWTLDGADFDFTTPVTGDITLTAVWEKDDEPSPATHKVTVDPANGGDTSVYEVEDGNPFPRPTDPTRDGYAFTGWTLDGKPYDFSRPVTGDITLTAQWEENETPAAETHTVRFRTNGGSNVSPQTVEDGRTASEPAPPTRPGHAFAGWLLDGQPYDFATPVTGDIILDAAWDETTQPDALSDVQALVDGTPMDGFDPTKDGTYTVSTDAEVEIVNVPAGWTLTETTGDDGTRTFSLTDGERTVTYTFTRGTAPDEPNAPDSPGTDDTPDAPAGGDGGSAAGQDADGGDDGNVPTEGLAATGVSPAGPLAGMLMLLGAGLAALRRRARR